ncbi:MAG: sulfite exporter TauE/SafE family protein [Bryobacteraceae bacterium]|nr:sulfite exporter TauE/SafE family protein [Bryobacteraceae bacterium]
MTYLGFLVLGLLAGVLGGMFGIGGGLIIVPALLYVFKIKEMDAIATSVAAMIPPVGLLGAIEYYRNGYIRIEAAALIAAGLFVGFYFGARIVLGLDPVLIRRIYAAFLVLIGARMLILGK